MTRVLRRKISIIGAGNVGATTAQLVRPNSATSCWWTSRRPGHAPGQGPRPGPGRPDRRLRRPDHRHERLRRHGAPTSWSSPPASPQAGHEPRRPAGTNAGIVGAVVRRSSRPAPTRSSSWSAIRSTRWCHGRCKSPGFPPERVIGQAGVLDTARFRAFIAVELGVSVEDISAMLLGGHGDTMVPLPSCTSVGGIPVTQLIAAERLDEIIERTRNGGAEIVRAAQDRQRLLRARPRPREMVEAIVRDKRRILPCAAYCRRVRRRRLLRRRADHPRQRRRGEDHRDLADGRRAGRLQPLRRRGARPDHEAAGLTRGQGGPRGRLDRPRCRSCSWCRPAHRAGSAAPRCTGWDSSVVMDHRGAVRVDVTDGTPEDAQADWSESGCSQFAAGGGPEGASGSS